MARGSKWSVWCCVFFVILRVIRTELLHFDSIESRKSPSPDFVRHTIIKPKIYHGREKREISSTRENVEGGHIHDLTIGYDVNGTDYVLDLRLNRELIPERFFTRYQHGGRHVVNRPTGRDVQLCQYQGHVRGRHDSWAAISTCHGLSGMIFDGEELHYLEPGSEEEHFLYKHSDITANQTCGYSGTPHHILENNDFNRILRYKRSSGVIRGPYNANRQSRYVELVLVVDNKEYKELGESIAKVNNHCKEIANIINALYQPLNIFVALVGVVVWTETDEISLSHNGDTTLTNFLHYRRERLVKEHPNDNAQLLTRWQFEGGVVGKALKGPICTFEFSGGVSMDHSSVVGLVATTVAHEMGHNLGMEHDTAECNCPSERCIMAPSSSSLSPTQWSSCSLDYLAVAFDHGMDYCLRNKPVSLFDSPVCGNGFVEAGEQCDCGLKDRCNNPCCNATSCMLYANASCATGECCDLATCRPKNAGSECRSAYHECDLPEFCTGQGEYCPNDVFKMDGETCDRGKAFCYQGSCRTHTDQCKLLWGPSGKSSDTLCYQMNTNGTRHGNCGFNKLNRSYIKCNDENIYCGMLHCRHLNERLEFGMESVSILSHSFINSGGSIIPCRTAIVDLGLNEVDPGLAPDGAKCGDGKMCVNQKCMAVGSLRHQTGACPMDCNGNGVCNSKGHCHCKVGFSPPHCDYPGTGGSQDSGPASDPNAQRDIMTALYIIFLGIVPLCALVAMFVYYTRHRATAFWKKTSLTSDSSPTKPKPPHIGRGNSLAFRERSQPPHARALEISSPVNARHGSDNAHASLLSDPAVPHVQIVGSAPQPPAPPAAAAIQTNLFGHFKGFSITPIASNPSGMTSPVKSPSPPLKAAPPPPRITSGVTAHNAVRIPSRLPNLGKSNSVLTSNASSAQKPPYVTKSNSVLNQSKPNNFLNSVNSTSISPALPPANSNSNARPLISAPVLDTTTCTVKELNSVRHPTRPAPEVPNESAKLVPAGSGGERPLSSVTVPPPEDSQRANEEDAVDGKVKEGGSYPTLTRLASFMLRQNSQENKKTKAKLDKEKTNSLPKSQVHGVKANRLQIDREALRNIQISNPIPQQDMEMPDNITLEDLESAKQVVMRAQSMRDNTTVKKRTEIPSFGSMRGGKRPTSIPPSVRPTSPPPRPPPPPLSSATPQDPGIVGLPGYQNPTEYAYDDCLNLAPLANIDEESPTSADNIYAVIEESPPGDGRRRAGLGDYSAPKRTFDYSAPTFGEYKTPKPIENSTSAGSVESVGLLSEIVNEIQARNVESIYSASTAERKKKEGYLSDDGTDVSVADKTSSNSSLGTYVNASNIYRPTGSVYSNMSTHKSSASSTCSSNGYLSPTPKIQPTSGVINAPTTSLLCTKPTPSPQPPVSSAPSINSLQSKTPLPSSSILNAKQLGVSNAGSRNLGSFSPPIDNSTPSKANTGPTTIVPSQSTRRTPEPVTEGYKPYSSSLQRSLGPLAASFKNAEASKSGISNTVKPKDEISRPSVATFKSPPSQISKPPLTTGVPSSTDTTKENVEPLSKISKLPTKPVTSVPKQNITSPTTSQTNPVSTPQKPTSNLPNKSVFNRSPTPPNLMSKQPSNFSKPTTVPGPPKSVPTPSSLPKKFSGIRNSPANSPDLVSSCSNGSNSNKSPDVLGKTSFEKPQIEKQLKPVSSVAKVGVGLTPKQPVPKPPERLMKSDSLSEKPKLGSVHSSFGDKNKFDTPKDSAKNLGVGKSASDVGKSSKISNVASLQQKFETASSDKDKPIGNVTSRTLSNVANNKKRPNISPSPTSSFKK